MKKLNYYITIGLLFNSFYLISNHFKLFPEFLKGLCAGVGIILILFGLYAEKHGRSRLKKCKRELIHSIFNNKR